MFIKIYLILSIIISFINAEPVLVGAQNDKVSILEYAETFVDETALMSIDEIVLAPFHPSKTDYAKLGYTSDALWVRFEITNDSSEHLQRYLVVSNPILDTVELYTKTDENAYTKEVRGVLHTDTHTKGNLLHPSVEVSFAPHETKTFYLKSHSISSANYFKLMLKDQNALYGDEFSYQIIEALFFGGMIALLVYNFFIFIFTRSLPYLYYVLYIFFITLNHASYSCMLDYLLNAKFDYLLNEDLIYIDAFLAIYYIGFINIFSLLFVRSFLEVHRYKWNDYILKTSIALNVLLMLMSSQNEYLIRYVSFFVGVSMFYIFCLCIFSYYHKNPQAKYILLGWSANSLGIAMLATTNFGAWSLIDSFPYFYESTVFFEATFFAIALASKLNQTKALEKAVQTNVVLTKELHHRVKNNMQFIILMYRLKLGNLINPKIDTKLKEIESSIQAISKTHEILYNQSDLERIGTQKYFEMLLDELKRSFNTQNITFHLNVDVVLTLQHSIYCGIIMNELITNAIKYAFGENGGDVYISLTKVGEKFLFVVEDNGIGFNHNIKGKESFGLSFVENIVKHELHGNFTIDTKKGCKVSIDFFQ